jgi:hypothetical protein
MILGEVRCGFFQKLVLHAELSCFAFELAKPGTLAHGQWRLITCVLTSIGVHPISESRLMDSEFLGHLGDRTRCLDHRFNGFFLKLRRVAPAIPRQPSSFPDDSILEGSLSGRFGAAQLLEDCPRARVFVGARGAVLRRGNFTRRFWRPAWDGDPESRDPDKGIPPILTGFTFHEGRHTHRTWLSDDGISDIGRAARLGHRLPGMADVYEHLTPEMKRRTLKVLQARWESSIAQLTDAERRQLISIAPPKLRESIAQREGRNGGAETSGSAQPKMISKISPDTA